MRIIEINRVVQSVSRLFMGASHHHTVMALVSSDILTSSLGGQGGRLLAIKLLVDFK